MLDGPPTPFFPSPELMKQFCTFHAAKVISLADPESRGRVLVECPGVMGKGSGNTSCWVEMSGNPVGSAIGKGDEGLWWPLQAGQCVLLGFVSGYPAALWCVPGPAPGDGGKPLIPAEPKSYGDGRKASRCRIIKSEAGHSILMDDNGKSELFAALNWTGSGLAIYGPGKEADDSEGAGAPSKPRKGQRRETKSIFGGDAPSPSSIVEGGVEYMALLDLIASGIYFEADDKKGGKLCIGVRKSPGEDPVCSLVMDAERKIVLLTAGECQMQLIGPLKRAYFTKLMIMETKLLPVKKYFSTVLGKLKSAFKKYKGS
jgi:hypothetical protein